MECNHIRKRLEAYLGDDLEGDELQAVIRHLAGCAGCRGMAEERDPLKLFLPLAGREEAGEVNWDGYWEDIVGRLEEQPHRRAGRLIPFPGSMRWVAAAGAVAATLILGVFLVQQDEVPIPVPIAEKTAEAETTAPADGDDELMEAIYIDRIAEALPAGLIERRGEVRALTLTRVDERDAGQVSHYRAGGDIQPAAVSDLQLAEKMDSVIEYNLVIGGDAGDGQTEEVRVVSFESEEFPFGCQAYGEVEEEQR